jgi:hypothetical protein
MRGRVRRIAVVLGLQADASQSMPALSMSNERSAPIGFSSSDAGWKKTSSRQFSLNQAFGVRLPGPFGVETDSQVPFGTSLKALPW